MIKNLLIALNHPLVVILHAIFGAGFIVYLQDTAYQSLLWFIPCMFVIIADLCAGVQAAKYRNERVSFSHAVRRTTNKALCYMAWILFCVTLDEQYGSHWSTWGGMGFVFFIEGCSFIGNILEPKGYALSVSGLLALIGRRHNAEGLEEIIEKHEK